MSQTGPNHTNHPRHTDDFLSLAYRAQAEDEELSGLLVEGADLEEADFSGLSLRDVTFSRCRFSGCDWSGCSFTDVTFHTCDLSCGNFEDSYWLRFAVSDSKSLALRLLNCRLREGIFADSRLSCANLDRSKLRLVQFSGTDLAGSFLTRCGFTHVEFHNCDLSQVSFVHTKLENVDLSTSKIGGLILSENCAELRGAVVDLYQAADLARRLGVVIKE